MGSILSRQGMEGMSYKHSAAQRSAFSRAAIVDREDRRAPSGLKIASILGLRSGVGWNALLGCPSSAKPALFGK